MPAYTTVVTHATGDVLPATDWNSYLRDDLAFLHDQGADLASAATITPTNQFHRVTGTTTITTIAAPTGTGQGGNRILLKFQSAGCAITAGAAIVLTNGAFVSAANGIIEFVWDATATAWIEIGRVNSDIAGRELDYKQITADVSTATTATSEAAATTIITGNSVTFDGTRIKIEFWAPGASVTAGSGASTFYLAIFRDTTAIGRASFPWNASGGGDDSVYASMYDTPAAGAHTYVAKAYSAGGTTPVVAIRAGTGGASTYHPAYLRETKA